MTTEMAGCGECGAPAAWRGRVTEKQWSRSRGWRTERVDTVYSCTAHGPALPCWWEGNPRNPADVAWTRLDAVQLWLPLEAA
jgi:hypothetical protein